MRGESAFDRSAARYDDWFDRAPHPYESELKAMRALAPERGRGLEVGVGTGRFAVPLGVRIGLDPSRAMAAFARRRGIDVVIGEAEALPFADRSFDFILFITTLCFVRDVPAALREAHRALHFGGRIVVGILDRVSPGGRARAAGAGAHEFTRGAVFLSAAEVEAHLVEAGFRCTDFRQTIFGDIESMKAPDPVRSGHGEGLFAAIAAAKPLEIARSQGGR